MQDEEPGLIARGARMLSDEVGGQVEIKVGDSHGKVGKRGRGGRGGGAGVEGWGAWMPRMGCLKWLEARDICKGMV